MSELLNILRQDAANLLEQNIPAANEVLPLVGALVGRLEQLEHNLVGELLPPAEPPASAQDESTFAPAPYDPPVAPAPAGPDPAVAQAEAASRQAQDAQQAAEAEAARQAAERDQIAQHLTEVQEQHGEALTQAQNELAAAQTRVAELEAQQPQEGQS